MGSQVEISIIIGVLGIIISGIVSVIVSYSKTKKKLDQLIAREFEGILTKEQAIELIDLYILMARRDLTYHINKYFQADFQKHLFTKSTKAMENAMHGIYSHSISEVGKKFSSFRLFGNKKIDFIIDLAGREPVLEAKKNILKILSEAVNSNLDDIETLKSEIFREMNDANDKGKELTRIAIERLYKQF